MNQIRKPRKPAKPEGRTAVYRLFDANGELLYVGCSLNPPARCEKHSKHKPWWHEVADRADEWHDTRAEAEAAEKLAIQTENPKYNVCHTPLQAKVCDRWADLTPEEAARWMRTWEPRNFPETYTSDPGSYGHRVMRLAAQAGNAE